MTTLLALRSKAATSYTWRSKAGRVLTEAEYAALPIDTKELAAARAKFQWRPDPKIVDALCAAERARTAEIGAR